MARQDAVGRGTTVGIYNAKLLILIVVCGGFSPI